MLTPVSEPYPRPCGGPVVVILGIDPAVWGLVSVMTLSFSEHIVEVMPLIVQIKSNTVLKCWPGS